jgi:hypothetical protein
MELMDRVHREEFHERNPWVEELLPLCEGLALLPTGKNKIPVDPANGKRLEGWQSCAFSVDEISELQDPAGAVWCLSYRPGPDSGNIISLDLDGDSASFWFRARGAEPDNAGWRTTRAEDRQKAHYRLPDELLHALVQARGETGLSGKITLTTKEAPPGGKAEQIELFIASGQCVIAGQPSEGPPYKNHGSPQSVTEPDEAMAAALIELVKAAPKPEPRSGGEHTPGESWQSGPDSPCPVCGRNTTGGCTIWVSDEENPRLGVNCFHGQRFRPPTEIDMPGFGGKRALEKADVVSGADGGQWVYCRQGQNPAVGTFSTFLQDRPRPAVFDAQLRSPIESFGSSQDGMPVRDALDAQDREELKLRFSKLQASMGVSLDLRDVLPMPLSHALIAAAEAMPVDPVALLGPLLCAIAATAGTRVEVFVKDGWREPLILWIANVLRPGAMKSPIASVVAQPMHRMEAEWRKDWEQLMREGGEFVAVDHLDPGQPPTMEPVRRIVLGDCSYERAVELMAQKNIPGLLSLQDELGGFFAQFQKHPVSRSGWLSLWSGGPAALDRKTVKSAYASKTATSLFGNMQPDKLASLLSEEKGQQSEGGDGLWSRFLWCRPRETVFRWSRAGVDVTDQVQELLESVDQQLQSFRLRLKVDLEVMDEFVGPLFEEWARDGVRTNSARSAFLSKLRGYTIRFMGVLCLLELAVRSTKGWRQWLNMSSDVEEFQLEYEIDRETMVRAVTLARFFLAQWDSLQPEVAPSELDGPPQWVAKFLRKVKDGDHGKVAPRDLVSWRLDKRIDTSALALAALKELEEKWGHGVVKQGTRKGQFWWEPATAETLNQQKGNC